MEKLQLSNRKLLGKFIEEAAVEALLIGFFLSRESFSAMHHAVTSTREGRHGMMQCYRRQHFAVSNDLHTHQRGHSSWKESACTKFMNIKMGFSKMRSEQTRVI